MDSIGEIIAILERLSRPDRSWNDLARDAIIGSMEADELLKQALALSDKERAELASSLIDSLDPGVDADTELAWQEEISRRFADIENGRVKTISWDEVSRKGRALLDGR